MKEKNINRKISRAIGLSTVISLVLFGALAISDNGVVKNYVNEYNGNSSNIQKNIETGVDKEEKSTTKGEYAVSSSYSTETQKALNFWMPFTYVSKYIKYSDSQSRWVTNTRQVRAAVNVNTSSDGKEMFVGVVNQDVNFAESYDWLEKNVWDASYPHYTQFNTPKIGYPTRFYYSYANFGDTAKNDSSFANIRVASKASDLSTPSVITPLKTLSDGTPVSNDLYDDASGNASYQELWDSKFDAVGSSSWDDYNSTSPKDKSEYSPKNYEQTFMVSIPIVSSSDFTDNGGVSNGWPMDKDIYFGRKTGDPTTTFQQTTTTELFQPSNNKVFTITDDEGSGVMSPLKNGDINGTPENKFGNSGSGYLDSNHSVYKLDFFPKTSAAVTSTTNNLLINSISTYPFENEGYFRFYKVQVKVKKASDNTDVLKGKEYFSFKDDAGSTIIDKENPLYLGNVKDLDGIENTEGFSPDKDDIKIEENTKYKVTEELEWEFTQAGLDFFNIASDPGKKISSSEQVLTTPSVAPKKPTEFTNIKAGETALDPDTRNLSQKFKVSWEQYNSEEAKGDVNFNATNIGGLAIVNADDNSVIDGNLLSSSDLTTINSQEKVEDYEVVWNDGIIGNSTTNVKFKLTYGGGKEIYSDPFVFNAPSKGEIPWTGDGAMTIEPSVAKNDHEKQYDIKFKIKNNDVVLNGSDPSEFDPFNELKYYKLSAKINGSTSYTEFGGGALAKPITQDDIDNKNEITIHDTTSFKPNKRYEDIILSLSSTENGDYFDHTDKNVDIEVDSLGTKADNVEIEFEENPTDDEKVKANEISFQYKANLNVDDAYTPETIKANIDVANSTQGGGALTDYNTGWKDKVLSQTDSTTYKTLPALNGLRANTDYNIALHLTGDYSGSDGVAYDETVHIIFKTDFASKDTVAITADPVVSNETKDSATVVFSVDVNPGGNTIKPDNGSTYKIVDSADAVIAEGTLNDGENTVQLTGLKKNSDNNLKLIVHSKLQDKDLPAKNFTVSTNGEGQFIPEISEVNSTDAKLVDEAAAHGTEEFTRDISFKLNQSFNKNDVDGYDESKITSIELFDGSMTKVQTATIPKTSEEVVTFADVRTLPGTNEDYTIKVTYDDATSGAPAEITDTIKIQDDFMGVEDLQIGDLTSFEVSSTATSLNIKYKLENIDDIKGWDDYAVNNIEVIDENGDTVGTGSGLEGEINVYNVAPGQDASNWRVIAYTDSNEKPESGTYEETLGNLINTTTSDQSVLDNINGSKNPEIDETSLSIIEGSATKDSFEFTLKVTDELGLADKDLITEIVDVHSGTKIKVKSVESQTRAGETEMTFIATGLKSETEYGSEGFQINDITIFDEEAIGHEETTVKVDILTNPVKVTTLENDAFPIWAIILIVLILLLLLIGVLLILAFFLLWIAIGVVELDNNSVTFKVNKKFDKAQEKLANNKLFINDKEYSHSLSKDDKGNLLIKVTGISGMDKLTKIKFVDADKKETKIIGSVNTNLQKFNSKLKVSARKID